MDIVVIGGGAAGLAAAYRLLTAGHRVVLYEASSRLGGQIHTERVEGFVVEHGAEGFQLSPRSPTQALITELGLAPRVLRQSTERTLAVAQPGVAPRELVAGEAAALLGLHADEEASGRGVATFVGGTGELTDRLAARLGERGAVRLDAGVSRIAGDGTTWTIEGGDVERRAEAAVVAVPPAAAARLLDQPFLADVPAIGNVTVSLAYRREEVSHPLDATGFVVAAGTREAPGLKACTFASSKFAQRAPDGWVLLRLFYRPGGDWRAEAGDEWWTDRAADDVARTLDTRGAPRRAWVSRWPGALPLYGDEHRRRARALARDLLRRGRLALAGAAFDGVGVPAAVESGLAAAETLLK